MSFLLGLWTNYCFVFSKFSDSLFTMNESLMFTSSLFTTVKTFLMFLRCVLQKINSFIYVANCFPQKLVVICMRKTTNIVAFFCQKLTGSTKQKVSIKGFFSKYDQIRSFLEIWSYLLKKALMENFIFCAVYLEHPWINYTPQYPYTCYMFPDSSYIKNFQGYSKGLFLLTSCVPLN